MNRCVRLVAAAAALGGVLCTGALFARDRRMPGPAGAGTANPSALIATEIALNRRARDKGQWNALGKFADDAAVLFVPQPVLANAWLGRQREPDQALQWNATKVWMSCDGTMGLTSGSWQRGDGQAGRFVTIWKERKKKREYRWVLELNEVQSDPVAMPDFLRAKVTDCPAPQPWSAPAAAKPREEITVTADGPPNQGRSDDGTFKWRTTTTARGDTTLTVSVLTNGANQDLVFHFGPAKGPDQGTSRP